MKKVCVIGCNGSIGNAICAELKQEYFVIGIDKDEKPNLNIHQFLPVDLNSTTEVQRLCENLKAAGELWALVFSAGLYPIVSVEEYTLDLWDEVINVNLKSSFQVVKELSAQIAFGGRLVFISSGAGYLGSKDIGYSVSKFGIQGLARGFAKHFGAKILVNTVSPGVIENEMSAKMERKRKAETISSTLLSRAGHPNELTEAVLFLLNPNNSYMTGATLDVNGGLYSR